MTQTIFIREDQLDPALLDRAAGQLRGIQLDVQTAILVLSASAKRGVVDVVRLEDRGLAHRVGTGRGDIAVAQHHADAAVVGNLQVHIGTEVVDVLFKNEVQNKYSLLHCFYR